MKKIISLMLSLMLISSVMAVSSFAADSRLFDKADVLTDEQEADIENSLEVFSSNWNVDTKVAVLPQAVGTDLSFDAENLYSELGMGENGLLLVLDCLNEEAAIHATGKAYEDIDEFGISNLSYNVSDIMDSTEIYDVIYAFIAEAGAEISYVNYGEEYIPSERILPRVIDEAALLDTSEQKELSSLIDEISERHNFDIAIATVPELDERNARDFSDDWFDYNGYGIGKRGNRSGVLFLISMGERDWAISTHDYGLTAFTDAGQELMMDRLLDDLSGGYYMDAFSSFAESCDEFLTAAENGEPIDVGNMPKGPMPLFHYVICIVIGLLIGFGGTAVLKNQLTTVTTQDRADSYTRKNSLKIPDKNERFLYSNVSRSVRPKPSKSSSGGSSSHTSSSGSSHGGSSGKF